MKAAKLAGAGFLSIEDLRANNGYSGPFSGPYNVFNGGVGGGAAAEEKTGEKAKGKTEGKAKEEDAKSGLTKNQKAGLKYFEALEEKMPRSEVLEIETIVKEAAAGLLPGVVAQAAGSYRRGKAMCGDIDVLICHPEYWDDLDLLSRLIDRLKKVGLIEFDLTNPNKAHETGHMGQYMGICRVPPVSSGAAVGAG